MTGVQTCALPIPLEHKQQVEQLNKAMEVLSDAQRQVLALRFAGEMTSEQVATVMGKTPGAVREMQSAAVKKLRDVMRAQAKDTQ